MKDLQPVNRYQFPCPVGVPPKYKTPEELAIKVGEYFQHIYASNLVANNDGTVQKVSKPKPPTLAGLALFLGFCDRRSLYDYEKRKLEGDFQFSHVIKTARSHIEDCIESGMLAGTVPAIPAIFALKNHHGWVDAQERDVNVHFSVVNYSEVPAIEDESDD